MHLNTIAELLNEVTKSCEDKLIKSPDSKVVDDTNIWRNDKVKYSHISVLSHWFVGDLIYDDNTVENVQEKSA